MKNFIVIIFLFISPILSYASFLPDKDKYTVSGHVTDKETGEELIGASVYLGSGNAGTTTNVYGFYSLTLPKGTYEISFSYMGYKTAIKEVALDENVRLNISLSPASQVLEEVQVTGERKNTNVEDVKMSTVELPIKTVMKIPVLLGEVDVIKSIQLLPGVQAGVEGSTGFYVRGGNVDQNLVLLDDAPIYNASHAAGFFSVFNADAIKNLVLYKGGIPAEYGGRLSSVLDIRMKEGNSKKLSGAGGVGLLSSRLTVEGPVIKDKCSFMISGRRTYFDLFMPFATDSMAKQSGLYFFDLNTKINYKINENNRVFLSGYFGRDVVHLGDVMNMDYGNGTGTLRWNHLFNEKLFFNATYIHSDYRYHLNVADEEIFSMDWKSSIIDDNLKVDLTYYLNPENTIKLGTGSIYHRFDPGVVSANMDSLDFSIEMPDNFALEHSFFVQNEQKISALLSLQYGLRISVFQNIGKSTYYLFDKSDPEEYFVTDTVNISKGEIFNTYTGIEPRIGARYSINEKNSVKASYNRTYQYLHMATNTNAATPFDIWIPSTPNVRPQYADQVAMGYFRNFKSNMFETSVEVYYKWMNNTIDFRDHAELMLNDLIEGELRVGSSYSYGAELLAKKQEGSFTGWVGYAISETMRDIPDVNNGIPYYAPYDRTHDISVVMCYDLNESLSISANWVYSTAPPRTMPTGRYEYQGMIVPVYSDRNSVRIFDYHRLDLSATYTFNKGKNRTTRPDGSPKRFESSLNVSVYNVYSRKNPYTIIFEQDDDDPYMTQAEMVYLFGIVPSLTYNFKF